MPFHASFGAATPHIAFLPPRVESCRARYAMLRYAVLFRPPHSSAAYARQPAAHAFYAISPPSPSSYLLIPFIFVVYIAYYSYVIRRY